MKRYASLMIAIAGLLFLAASASAETSYRLELYGSGNFPLDKHFEYGPPQAQGRVPGDYQFSAGARGGVRVGVDGMGHWGQDVSYSYGQNEAKIIVAPAEFAFTPRSHQFAYNAIFYPAGLRGKKLHAYVTVGAGGTIFTLSQADINKSREEGIPMETHTSFTFNAGGGFWYHVGKVGFRLDVRDWMSHPPRFGIPASSDVPEFILPVHGVFHQLEASAAIVFCFGAPK